MPFFNTKIILMRNTSFTVHFTVCAVRLRDFLLLQDIATSIREAAQQATTSHGFVFDETTGLYYDYNTGYYYDPVSIYIRLTLNMIKVTCDQ